MTEIFVVGVFDARDSGDMGAAVASFDSWDEAYEYSIELKNSLRDESDRLFVTYIEEGGVLNHRPSAEKVLEERPW